MPLAKLMQKLLTRYAVWFNLRHRRAGHFFQNRYKAILCEEEPYFLELVRYIHLNPWRVGEVENLEALGRYPWCGHGAIVGRIPVKWQDSTEVLCRFGRSRKKALRKFMEFMVTGMKDGKSIDLRGGGLVRSVGGLSGLKAMRRSGQRMLGDERILGSGEFVAETLRKVEKRDRRREWLGARLSPAEVIRKAAGSVGVDEAELRVHGKRPRVAMARALACKWLVEDLGLPGVMVAGMLGITKSAVSKCALKGRFVENKLSVMLDAVK